MLKTGQTGLDWIIRREIFAKEALAVFNKKDRFAGRTFVRRYFFKHHKRQPHAARKPFSFFG
ncbi:MAG: hypothetical protein JNK89_09605 [Saprospiraceae bacterium]|nr:hypothetical protein [Saprospiraceae bacterium]